MLYCDALRGWDSTGMFLVNKYGNTTWMKNKYHPTVLFQHKEWGDAMDAAFKNGRILIGHNRKATQGSVSDENAHPFVEDNIVLVHNGTIYNHKKLADVEVDSHAITHLIKDKGAKKGIKEIDGAFALVWYDAETKNLNLIRNSQRPLNLIETSDAWYISSEKEMIDWLLGRENNEKIISSLSLEVGKLYTFNCDNTEKYSTESLDLYTVPKQLPSTNVLPHGKKETTTGGCNTSANESLTKKSSGLSLVSDYKIGQEIIFEIEDYSDKLSTYNPVYDGILFGKIAGKENVRVRCYFLEEHWKNFSDTGKVAGELERVVSSNGGIYLWLKPGTLITSWELLSSNGILVDNEVWGNLPHKCYKCKDSVDFWEVEDCIVKYTEKKKRILCPKCTADIELRKVNGRHQYCH